MVSNSTNANLVSWQLDDNNRSAWDILWACASTIFACTWTVIHGDVPLRHASDVRQTIMFLRVWFIALLLPEAIFAFAWRQFMAARESKKIYNMAQTSIIKPTNSVPNETPMHQSSEKPFADSESEKWSLTQAFCIQAGGLALRTTDEWVYSVSDDEEMVAMIQSGVVRPSDFSEQEIQSRAKTDSFAKLFTLCQVTWFLCNAFARWGYRLPVSPLELATVAYVVIAILIYLSWWHKPKDVSTPILTILSCDRRHLEERFPGMIKPGQWSPLHTKIEEDSMLNTARSVFNSSMFAIDTPQEGEVLRNTNTGSEKNYHSLISFAVYSFATQAYCGIHLAEWNFAFPTNTERVAWNSFALITMGAASCFMTIDFLMVLAEYIRDSGQLPSCMASLYNESHWKKGVRIQLIPKQISTYIYVLARLGIMALVCASMRALPGGSYTTVEWVTSIPHF